VGDEDLRAVEQEVVALVGGGGGRAAGVAARPGSVRPKPPSTFPDASSGTYFSFCAWVPKSMIGEVPRLVCALMVSAWLASTLASSWMVM
jgi:hypothetical protein